VEDTATTQNAMTPREAAKLRILDPACGSGSFLLGAYEYLLEWHLNWYVADGPERHPKELTPAPGGGFRLSVAAKKRILVSNIYGVDVDPQAVEVTKLSLLLKVLEGETSQSLSLFAKERALPDLDRNIRCGNSLIGPDFFEGERAALLNNEEERQRINAFDWQAAFPKVMKAGGFDAVIGNPPYVNAWELFGASPDVRSYITDDSHYTTADRHWDLYVIFLERALGLLRPKGQMSFIIPSPIASKSMRSPRAGCS
jgi:type I restriction-modification system DNA methylase subunit